MPNKYRDMILKILPLSEIKKNQQEQQALFDAAKNDRIEKAKLECELRRKRKEQQTAANPPNEKS